MGESSWKVFDIGALMAQMSTASSKYKEFLRVPSVSCGIYHLPAGSKDMQTPHDEDELYYVLEGRAQLRVGDDIQDVKAGALLFVEAAEEHSFFEIVEDMTLLVVFPSSRRS